MILCAILGDSLAAGVAEYRQDCLTDTEVGISSSGYLAHHVVAVITRMTGSRVWRSYDNSPLGPLSRKVTSPV